MTQKTALSVAATPGRMRLSSGYVGPKGAGPFTELSVMALPGGIHSFSPKASASPKGVGLFTELSVMALPGRIHSFIAKTAELVTEGTRRQRQIKSLIKSRRRRKC